jgi:hypothetical protein
MGDMTDRIETDRIPPATGVSWPGAGPETDPLRIGEPVMSGVRHLRLVG